MLIRTLVAPLLGASCHVLVAADGRCVVVDPGGGVAAELVDLLSREGWTPVALLATHGHVDHTWSAAELSEALGVPFLIHEDDLYLRSSLPVHATLAIRSQASRLAGYMCGTTTSWPCRSPRSRRRRRR